MGNQECERKQQKWRIGKTLLRVAQGMSDDRAWKGVWAANLPCLKLQVVLSAPQIGIKLLPCVRRVRRKAGREERLSFPR